MRTLISGASISGPVLAYWLSRYGFQVTVVEHPPAFRKTGGHAVDLSRPAVEISEKGARHRNGHRDDLSRGHATAGPPYHPTGT